MKGLEIIVLLVISGQNASSERTVNYAIASPELLTKIMEFQVISLDKCLSDVHSVISVTLQFCCTATI